MGRYAALAGARGSQKFCGQLQAEAPFPALIVEFFLCFVLLQNQSKLFPHFLQTARLM
jgi:hypothetical protein